MSAASLHIRFAEARDTVLILAFIRELAAFEGMESQITATTEDIRVSLFERKQAEVIIADVDGSPAAFALFFHNYSTFLGKANLHLEDLFVREEYRGKGIGKAMLRRLAQIAVDRGGERLDWLCLDANDAASDFYRKLGAEVLSDRRVFRISGNRLVAFAKQKSI